MTRMTGPDCVVMCNLINTYIHTYIHTYTHRHTHHTVQLVSVFFFTKLLNVLYLVIHTIIVAKHGISFKHMSHYLLSPPEWSSSR